MWRIKRKGDLYWLYDPETADEHELLHRKSLDHCHKRLLSDLGHQTHDQFTDEEPCDLP